MTDPSYQRNVRLAEFTTFRLGGPASVLFPAHSCDDVVASTWQAEGMGLPWQVIGHGSNLLVSDKGYDGAIIVFQDNQKPRVDDEGHVVVSGGYSLFKLITFMSEQGLSGLEDLAGIPGTVGGAITGNAGAYGTSISDCIESVLLLGKNGVTRRLQKEQLGFSYRSSLMKQSGEVTLEVTLKAKHVDPVVITAIIEQRLADRSRKHPDPAAIPTAGSYFRNPENDDGMRIAAGKLLEAAGCQHLRVGGARLWHSHANIIVTDRNATASHVQELATQMVERVFSHSGVRLAPEVVFLE